MRRNILIGVVLCAVFVGGVALAEEVVFPYVGKVTAERVNVRAGSGTNYKILTVARKDEILVVFTKKGEWLKIECPERCKVWVHSRYVKRNEDGGAVVTGNSLKVRATNNTRSAAVAELNKGDRVEIIRQKDDWFQIKAPEGAIAWIHTDYVQYIDEHGAYLDKARKRMAIENLLAELEKTLAEERAEKQPEEWDLDFLLEGYARVRMLAAEEDLGSVSKTMSAKAGDRLAELARIKDLQIKLVEASEKLEINKREYEKRMEELKNPVSSYVAKGWIEDLGMIRHRPGTHKLKMGGDTLYILKSDRHNLYDYVGFLVGIDGRVFKVSGWDIPVIDVENIDVLYAEKSEF